MPMVDQASLICCSKIEYLPYPNLAKNLAISGQLLDTAGKQRRVDEATDWLYINVNLDTVKK